MLVVLHITYLVEGSYFFEVLLPKIKQNKKKIIISKLGHNIICIKNSDG